MSHNILTIPEAVKVMAVIKNRSVEHIKQVLENYPISILGANKWQDAERVIDELPNALTWHFIGHLQTNKVKYIVPRFSCIESVDSYKLLTTIQTEAAKCSKIQDVFLQVNISNDDAKYGFSPQELEAVLATAKKYPSIAVKGLMTITAKQPREVTMQHFRSMKKLKELYQLQDLSMGMSEDWQVACEEGATIIRLGRALFEDAE